MIALYCKWSAFHLFRKLLVNGLGNGWLFTKGYTGLLSTIEEDEDGVRIQPYVRLFSKRGARRLMGDFQQEDLSVHPLQEGHFWPNSLARAARPWLGSLENRLGWYVAYQGTKRGVSSSPR